MIAEIYEELKPQFIAFKYKVVKDKLIMSKGGSLIKVIIDCSEIKDNRASCSIKVVPGAYLLYFDLKNQLAKLKEEIESFFQQRGIDIYQLHQVR